MFKRPRSECLSSGLKTSIGLAALGLAASTALAVPYATGLINTGTSISFRLNESADMVRIIYNGGASTLNLGALPAGIATANVTITGTFKVEVTKTSGPGYTQGTALQISSDSNTLLQWEQPVGVAVNQNPKSPYFGRIYVANSRPLSTATGRLVQEGIYVLNPDFTDALGQGNNALTGGLDFSDQSGNTQNQTLPWKLEVGEDDNLYIADFTSNSGTVYVTDPNVSAGSGTNVLEGMGSPFYPNASLSHGQIASSPIVTGSLAKSNLTVYVLDADIDPLNGLKRFDVNEGPLPSPAYYNDLSGYNSPLLSISRVIVDLDRAQDGKFFLSQYRSDGKEVGLAVLSSQDNDGDGVLELLYNSLTDWREITGDSATNDYMRHSYAIKISPNGKYLAVGTSDGPTHIVPLDPTTGLPVLTNRVTVNTAAAGPTRDVAFDAAGNLYIVNNNIELLRVFSPGGRWVSTTGSDGTFLVTSPVVTTPEVSISATHTNMYERVSSQTATVTLSRAGDTSTALTVQLAVTGNAVSGVDYEAIPNTLVIPAGAQNASFTVKSINNTSLTGDRAVIIGITDTAAYDVVASQASVALRITDDESEPGTVLFSDDFETDSSAKYDVLFKAADGVEDYSVDWAYDYSQDGIPSAPHSATGTTKGVRLHVNKDANGSPAAVNLFVKGTNFTGDFALRADVYMSIGEDAGGTTEHALAGINHSGNNALGDGFSGIDGLWFAIDADGANLLGFDFYGTTDSSNPTKTRSNTEFAWAFPSPPYAYEGVPSNSTNRNTGEGVGGIWADVEVRQQAGVITFKVNNTTIFTFPNTYAYKSGKAMIGHNDQYASIGSMDNYSLWDNVRVVSLTAADLSIHVTGVRISGGNIVIDFTAVTPGTFVALSSTSVTGTYAPDATVTFTTVSPGVYRATTPATGASRFFKFSRGQ
jgi:hypothetical protein